MILFLLPIFRRRYLNATCGDVVVPSIKRRNETMGDVSTHAIFYSAYWHLAVLEDGEWIDTNGFERICSEGQAEKVIALYGGAK